MRNRIVLGAGLLLLALRCGGDDASSGSGGRSGSSGDAGSSGSGTGGTRGGTSGDGGMAGDGGEETGGRAGSSGSAGKGGTAGGGGDAGGAGQAGQAGAGGQDGGGQTVSGWVGQNVDLPVQGVVVAIGSETATTDANGHFEIPDVSDEYDVVLIQEDKKYAQVQRGLRSRTPSFIVSGVPAQRGATVAGVVTGGAGVPIPTDHFAEVAFSGSHVASTASLSRAVRAGDGSYSANVLWYGAPSISGSLHAIAYQLNNMGTHIVGYDGYGTRPFDLSDGGTFGDRTGSTTATTIALRSVTARSVTGTLSAPSGYDPILWFNLGPFLLDTRDIANGPYSSVLPTGIPELPTYVQVHAEHMVGAATEVSETSYLIADSTATLDLTTAVAPALILPVDAAVAVDYETVFSWTPSEDSVCVVAFFLGDDWLLEYVQDSSSVTIPDLTSYGIGLSPGEPSSWIVTCTFVDDVEGWSEFYLDRLGYLAAHGTAGDAFSVQRRFTASN